MAYATPRGEERIDPCKAARPAGIWAAVAMSRPGPKLPERAFNPAAHAVSRRPAMRSAAHAISTSEASGRPGKPLSLMVRSS